MSKEEIIGREIAQAMRDTEAGKYNVEVYDKDFSADADVMYDYGVNETGDGYYTPIEEYKVNENIEVLNVSLYDNEGDDLKEEINTKEIEKYAISYMI